MKKHLLGMMVAIATTGVATAQLTENFETTTGSALPAGWSQTVAAGVLTDSTGWLSGTNTSLGSSDFPMSPHTRFVAVNDDKYPGANNGNSFLMSPVFSLGTGSSWWLKFACSYLAGTYSGASENATVEVSTDGGSTWTVLTTLTENAADWWEPRYIDMSAYAGMSNLKIGFRYKDNGGWLFGFGIDDVEVMAPPANELALTSIAPLEGTPNSYGLAGSGVTVTGTVFNNGGSTVTSFDVKYVFNGGAVVTNPVTGVSIAPFTSGTFTATTPVTLPSAVGAYNLKVWAELAGDTNPANDSAANNRLNTVAFLPTKKLAIEEGTGTWCQWCPRGLVYMDSLHVLYGDNVSLVAVHNSDPMEVPAYDSWLGGQIGGYPSVVVDRRMEADPSELLDVYTQHATDFGFADITTTPTLTGSNLSVDVKVRPALALTGAKLALVMTENDVTGTGAGWAQANAYSGSSSVFLSGGGVNYNALPNPIPASQMNYDFVARSIDPDPAGGAGLLPASMSHSTDYTYTFNKPLSTSWTTNKLHGVVLLIDGTSGAVLNSQNFGISLGVDELSAGVQHFVVAPNPANHVAQVIFDLQEASEVSVEVVDMLGRVVWSQGAHKMIAGTNIVQLPMALLANGMYHARVKTATGVASAQFSVMK